MKMQIAAFTAEGVALAEKIKEKQNASAKNTEAAEIWRAEKESLSAFTERGFREKNALLFIGACGIAVRSIAPLVESKLTDPPVLVMDERGQFVIPLLSSHVGGAGRLAKYLAELLGAIPVLTTASDVKGLFAADEFAARNHLLIADRERAKEVSVALVAGKKAPQIIITPEKLEENGALQLIPRTIILGAGCRKGKTAEELLAFIEDILEQEGLCREAVYCIASLDRKEKEPGLRQAAERLGALFLTYTAKELEEQQACPEQGGFTASAFVMQEIGVDNVCERAAVAAGAERLLRKKTARDGMTLAVGIKKGRYYFA